MANLDQLLSEIKPIKQKFSKTMKNIDVLYSTSSLDTFVNSLKKKKTLQQTKLFETSTENKYQRIQQLRELNSYLDKLKLSDKVSNPLTMKEAGDQLSEPNFQRENEKKFKDSVKMSDFKLKLLKLKEKAIKIKQNDHSLEGERVGFNKSKSPRSKDELKSSYPELGRYYPNYNSIYKNIHGVVMKKPINELNRSITILKPFISQNSIDNEKTRNSGSFLTGIESSRTFKTNQSNCLTEKSVRKDTIGSYTDRSSYYKTSNFDKYSSRKFIIDEKRVGKILTYMEPFDYAELYKKNSPLKNSVKIPGIKLSKLSPRNHVGLINQNNYPTPFTYSPNLNSIKPKVKNSCVYSSKTKENIKKNIIRKVCFSYDQNIDIRVAKLKNLIDLAK